MSEKTYEGEMSFADAVAAAAAHRAAQNPPVQPVQEPVATTDSPVEPPKPVEASVPAAEPAYEAALEALRAEIEALKAQKAAPEAPKQEQPPVEQPFELDFESHFAIDPAGAIAALAKRMNLDPGSVAEDTWYEKLGDKAPPDYRARKEGKRGQLAAKAIELRQAQERKQAEEHYAARQAEEAQARYVGALKSFATTAPADKFGLTSKLAAESPDMVVGALWNHAARIAQQSGGKHVATPEEAAAELEKELQTLARVLAPVTAPPAPVSPPVDPTPASIRNQFSQVQPSKAPANELDDDFLRAKAMAELARVRAAQG